MCSLLGMQGKVAIVTGASSGIGLAIAKKWVDRGGRVALVARTASKLDEAVRAFGEDRAAAFALDVTQLDRLEKLPGQVVERFGRLDVLVNNAGLNHRGPASNFTPRELADVVTTNLTAPVVLTRAALPYIERGGSIVQLASIAGMVAVPGEASYCASKAGLRAFARALSYELEQREIHVGSVCPGPVDTGFLGDLSNVPDIVLSQPMLSVDEVADGVFQCIDERLLEIALPRRSGQLATVGYLAPSLAKRMRPMLEKRGAKNKLAILARRRSVV